jgi:hypothetical protein
MRSKEGMAGLGLLGLLAFTGCFSYITLCKKLLKGGFFSKNRFRKRSESSFLQSQGFFLRLQIEESF